MYKWHKMFLKSFCSNLHNAKQSKLSSQRTGIIQHTVQILIFILIFIFAGNYAKSQFAGDKKVFTLGECIKIAQGQNFEVKLRESQVILAGAQVTQAFGNYLPSINFAMNYNRTLNPDGGQTANIGGQIITIGKQEPNSYSMQAYANLSIFDGFGREAVFAQTMDNFESIAFNSKHTQKKVEIAVINRFLEINRYQQIVKIRQENILLAKSQLEQIKAQQVAGLIPITNVYAQEAEMGNQEYELIVAENEMNKSKAELLSLMGYSPDFNAEFLDSSIPQDISQTEIANFRRSIGTIGSASRQALENRLDYASMNSTLKAAESGIAYARSDYYPKVMASGGWSWSNTFFNDFDKYGRYYLGLSLQVPVFQNFSTNTAVQNAQLRFREAEIQKLQAEQDIISNVQVGFYNLESTEKQMEVTQRVMKSSEMNYLSVKERYNVGAATITELLIATNQYTTARINRVNSVYSYYLSQKNLLYAIGML